MERLLVLSRRGSPIFIWSVVPSTTEVRRRLTQQLLNDRPLIVLNIQRTRDDVNHSTPLAVSSICKPASPTYTGVPHVGGQSYPRQCLSWCIYTIWQHYERNSPSDHSNQPADLVDDSAGSTPVHHGTKLQACCYLWHAVQCCAVSLRCCRRCRRGRLCKVVVASRRAAWFGRSRACLLLSPSVHEHSRCRPLTDKLIN